MTSSTSERCLVYLAELGLYVRVIALAFGLFDDGLFVPFSGC
jgi:hypothetical protein